MSETLADDGSPAAEREQVEVRYELIPRDAVYGYWLGILGRGRTLLWVLLYVGVLAVLTAAVGGPGPAGAIVVALVLLLGVVVPWWIGRQARRNPAFRGPHKTCISREGIGSWTDGVGTSELLWSSVEQIRATRTHVILQMRGAPSAVIAVIPRSAFAIPGEVEEFVRKAQEWRAAALKA